MLIPNVKQVNGIWSGNVTLDSWNNFFNKEMDIDLNIGGDKLIESLNSRHKFAYEYLVTNQEKLLQIILNALLVEYPIMQEEYGYEDDTLDSNLYRLAARCREFAKIGLSFPHEIGAFLEYPMEDVKDFIRKQGKDFLCNGYWKVYHNPANAMAIFNAYDRAKTCAVEEFIKGESIFEITRRLL